MYLHLIVVGLLYFTLTVLGTTIFPCEENMPLPLAVWGSGCSDLPCIIDQSNLEQTDFYVTFNATHDIYDGKLHLYWNAETEDLTEFEMPFKSLCEGLIVGKCPLSTGQLLTYHTFLFETRTFEDLYEINVKLMMLDGNDDPVFCFKSLIAFDLDK